MTSYCKMNGCSAGASALDKPSYLILGGTGFIGRHLVAHLVSQEISNKILVIDRVPPALAWLNEEHKAMFNYVTFRQANLINPNSVNSIFDSEKFDFVVNLAAETRLGQSAAVYEEGVVTLSRNCAEAAARAGVKRYIELSSSQVNSSDKPVTEESSLSPWTELAKHKVKVEEVLSEITTLNYVIIRPAIVYGVSDIVGLTPRLIIGAVYRHLGEKMKVLWTKNLFMNTVHVEDVCEAVCHLCYHGDSGEVYNLVDSNCTTQGTINDIVSDIFNIDYDYAGSFLSNMARINMEGMVEDINEKHMTPWATMCKKSGIENTPLSPYLDQELLYNKHTNLSGTKIQVNGFRLRHPKLTRQAVKQVLDDFVSLGIFPKTDDVVVWHKLSDTCSIEQP